MSHDTASTSATGHCAPLLEEGEGKCTFNHGVLKPTLAGARTNTDWWPNPLNLKLLAQHAGRSNPMGPDFHDANELNSLDLTARSPITVAMLTAEAVDGPKKT